MFQKPKNNPTSKEWKRSSSPCSKNWLVKLSIQSSETIRWNSFATCLEQGKTITVVYYTDLLTKLCPEFVEKHHKKFAKSVLFTQDKPPDHKTFTAM